MKQNEIFAGADFIKADKKCVSPIFFGKFTADTAFETEISVCGLGFFYLYINGKKVGNDLFAPVTSFYHRYENCYCEKEFGEIMKSRIYVEKYDISDYVVSGENTVAVFTGPGWYHLYSDFCVCCYKITNGENTFVSGKDNLWVDGPLTEYIFARGEKQDFTKLDYTDIFGKYDMTKANKCELTVLPETEFYYSDCPNDKVIYTTAPEKIGETSEYDIYDVGENISGRIVFNCKERSREINITVSEELDSQRELHEKWIHHQQADFITDGTDRDYSLLFTWHAFRYFRISKGAENIRCEIIHTDAAVTSSFKSENKVLNWLYDAFIRTQLTNMHAGIPSDCPHIERRGYTGDGQLTSKTVMLTVDSERFYRKWINDIADCQDTVSGHIQYTAPYVPSGGGPGGWGCAINEVPYNFYKVFGDIKPFEENFDGMLNYLDYLEAHSENDLVTSDQPDCWCLGDWCTPHEIHGQRPDIPTPFVNNYFYIKTIDKMLELCAKIGRESAAEKLKEIRQRKVDALNKAYFDPTTGDFAGNLNSADAFAVDIGLGDERTLSNLIKHVKNDPLDTGIFGTDIVTKILCENGYIKEAVEYLSRKEYPSFGFMMNSGATTLWEEWQDPRSMSHPMFGGCVKYLFEYLLGIRQPENSYGFERIEIKPFANELTGNIEGFITTKRGVISVKVDTKTNTCTVKVPDKIETEIIFDGKIIIEN